MAKDGQPLVNGSVTSQRGHGTGACHVLTVVRGALVNGPGRGGWRATYEGTVTREKHANIHLFSGSSLFFNVYLGAPKIFLRSSFVSSSPKLKLEIYH